MEFKNPIYTFSIAVLLFGLYVIFFIYGLYGIFAVLYLYGIYSVLIGISFLLKKFEIKRRIIYESLLIIFYISFFTLYHLNWSVGSEIFLGDNKKPFIGEEQNFAIIFGIKNSRKLPNNWFTDNEIRIPNSGVLLTSSTTDDYKWSYQFDSNRSMERFITSYFITCNCYGKENYKFDYLAGAISDSAEISRAYIDSLIIEICIQLEAGKIISNKKKGYKNGDYLSQLELTINNEGLERLPRGVTELKNLEYLSIHTNNFSKFPEEIFQLKGLKTLYIGYNSIDSLPKEIGTLSNLEVLGVNNNQLTDLPDALLNLKKLRAIYIWGNNMDEEIIERLKQKYRTEIIRTY
ncbi:MAG: leucine-rich repeat domain-containing protein [Bacteroidetes bacterium]|nr:leucine-rich repeat domain-containing protein [Bacteroidota bacterium]